MAEIQVKISRDGSNVEVDAVGFSGSACTQFTDAIAQLGSVSSQREKPEFHELVENNLLEGN